MDEQSCNKMMSVDEYDQEMNISSGFAWRDFNICCSKDKNEYIYGLYDTISEYIDKIAYDKRRLVERNYRYKKVYVYDYYFILMMMISISMLSRRTLE